MGALAGTDLERTCVRDFRPEMSRSFHSLPDEALRLILRFLSVRCSSTFSYALTCKRWLRLARLAVSSVHVDESRGISGRLLLASLSRFRNLTSLQLANGSVTPVRRSFLYSLGRICPNLISLALPDLSLGSEIAKDQLSEFSTDYFHGLEGIFQSCTALQKLSLVLPVFITALPPSLLSLPCLKHLRLTAHGLRDLPASDIGLRELPASKMGLRELPASEMSGFTSALEILEIESDGLQHVPDTLLLQWGCIHELTLSCENLQCLPDISGQLSSLNFLCLNLPQLERFPEEFCKLPSLISLKLLSCSNLDSLPEELGHLHSLKTLELIRLQELSTLPESLGQLLNLEKLHLMACPAFEQLPESSSLLTDLKSLRIIHCESLSSLPDGIGNLHNLQVLEVTGSLVLERLPLSVTALKSLTSLSVCRCEKFQALPEDIGQLTQLQELAVVMIDELTELPESLSCLPRLEALVVSDCVNLQSLPKGLQNGQMKNLRRLELSDLPSLEGLPRNLGQLLSIREVQLRGDNLVKQPQLKRVFSPQPWFLPAISSVMGLLQQHIGDIWTPEFQDSESSLGLKEHQCKQQGSCRKWFTISPPDPDCLESDPWIVTACEL